MDARPGARLGAIRGCHGDPCARQPRRQRHGNRLALRGLEQRPFHTSRRRRQPDAGLASRHPAPPARAPTRSATPRPPPPPPHPPPPPPPHPPAATPPVPHSP